MNTFHVEHSVPSDVRYQVCARLAHQVQENHLKKSSLTRTEWSQELSIQIPAHNIIPPSTFPIPVALPRHHAPDPVASFAPCPAANASPPTSLAKPLPSPNTTTSSTHLSAPGSDFLSRYPGFFSAHRGSTTLNTPLSYSTSMGMPSSSSDLQIEDLQPSLTFRQDVGIAPRVEMGSSQMVSQTVLPTAPNGIATKKLDEDGKALVDPKRYKTNLCRNYERFGKCPYEDRCAYAHGLKELRSVSENTSAVHSLEVLALQLKSKLGPKPLSSLGPVRHRKRKSTSKNEEEIKAGGAARSQVPRAGDHMAVCNALSVNPNHQHGNVFDRFVPLQ